MITRRGVVLALGAGALAPLGSFAQQPGKVWRIGFLTQGVRKAFMETGQDAFLRGLRRNRWRRSCSSTMQERMS